MLDQVSEQRLSRTDGIVRCTWGIVQHLVGTRALKTLEKVNIRIAPVPVFFERSYSMLQYCEYFKKQPTLACELRRSAVVALVAIVLV